MIFNNELKIIAGLIIFILALNGLFAGLTFYGLFNQMTFSGSSISEKNCNLLITKWGSYTIGINGSTGYIWAWSTNATELEEWALGNVTTGLIILKNLQHNTALTIPANVIVQEQYNNEITHYGGYLVSEGALNGGFDYYIRNNGGTIEAFAGNGSLVFSGADFGAVWNDALTDMDWTGRVGLRGGDTFTATEQPWINGTGAFLDKTIEVTSVGGGPWAIIAPTANYIHGFALSGGPNLYLHKLQISMKTTATSGSALYGINVGGNAYEENSAFLSRFEDLNLTGCSSGIWVWYMEDMEWAVLSGQIYVDGGWEANGVWFKTTSGSQFGYGENHYTGSLYISTTGTDTICWLLEGSGTGHMMTLATGSAKFWLRNDGGSDNSTGLWTKSITSAYLGVLHIENVEFHVIANDTDFTIFDWGLQTTTISLETNTVSSLASTCQGNVIMNVHILGGNNNFTAFYDGNTDQNNPNTYDNICLRAFIYGNILADMAVGVYYDDDYDGAGRWYKKFGGGTYP